MFWLLQQIAKLPKMTGLSLVLSNRQGLQSQRDKKAIQRETSVYKAPSQGRVACLATDRSRAGHITAGLHPTTRNALYPTETGAAGNKKIIFHFVKLLVSFFCFWCFDTIFICSSGWSPPPNVRFSAASGITDVSHHIWPRAFTFKMPNKKRETWKSLIFPGKKKVVIPSLEQEMHKMDPPGVGTVADLAKDLGSVPSTHTVAHNHATPVPGHQAPSYGLCRHTCGAQAYTCRQSSHTHFKKERKGELTREFLTY